MTVSFLTGGQILPSWSVPIERLGDLAQAVHSAKRVGFALKGTDQDPCQGQPRLLQVAFEDGRVALVDLPDIRLRRATVLLEALTQTTLVGHDLLPALILLRRAFPATPLPDRLFDLRLAMQVAQGGIGLAQDETCTLTRARLNGGFPALPTPPPSATWGDWMLSPLQVDYAQEEVARFLTLADQIQRKRIDPHKLQATLDLENALLPVVAQMTQVGVPFKKGAWIDLLRRTQQMARESLGRLHAHRQAVFPEMDEGSRSAPLTDAEILETLHAAGILVSKTGKDSLVPYRDDPFVQELLTFRPLQSFTATASSILEAANRYSDDRLRPQWRQIGAVTGRMATRDPCLLNLPKRKEVRACVVAPRGQMLIVADYAHADLRVLAEVTGDVQLIQVFQDGRDPHTETARMLTKRSDVTPEERQFAKAINFGVVFGMGAETFTSYALASYGVVCTADEAKEALESYYRQYSGVRSWQRAIQRTNQPGRTLGGRIQFFGRDSVYTERLSMPVQGTAADGFKNALVRLYQRLGPKRSVLLAVHDEVVVMCPTSEGEETYHLVEACMKEGMAMYVKRVPIVVDAKQCQSWDGTPAAPDLAAF